VASAAGVFFVLLSSHPSFSFFSTFCRIPLRKKDCMRFSFTFFSSWASVFIFFSSELTAAIQVDVLPLAVSSSEIPPFFTFFSEEYCADWFAPSSLFFPPLPID